MGEIFSRALGNFEEQNKIFESSEKLLITELLLMHSIYHYIINSQHNSCISNGGLLEEYDKEQNMAVTVAAAASCLNRRLYNVLFNVTYWVRHRQSGTPMTNIQSTLRTPPICVRMIHSQRYLVATVIHIQSVHSQMCVYTYLYIYTHTCPSQYGDDGRAKEI